MPGPTISPRKGCSQRQTQPLNQPPGTRFSFLLAFGNLPAYRGESLRTWFYRHAVRVCLLELLRRGDCKEGGVRWPERRALASHVERSSDTPDFERCLSVLPPGQKLAVLLVDREGLDYQEAEQVMEVSHNEIVRCVSQARRTMVGAASM